MSIPYAVAQERRWQLIDVRVMDHMIVGRGHVVVDASPSGGCM